MAFQDLLSLTAATKTKPPEPIPYCNILTSHRNLSKLCWGRIGVSNAVQQILELPEIPPQTLELTKIRSRPDGICNRTEIDTTRTILMEGRQQTTPLHLPQSSYSPTLSPWSRKVSTYLNHRGPGFTTCEQPVYLPRPYLNAFGLQYRHTLVLSIGCDICCETLLIL
jgi:hypothetical protein